MTLDSRTKRRIGYQTEFVTDLDAKYEALGFKLSERLDAWSYGLVEAICHHGVGHPIPESIKEREVNGSEGNVGTWGIHGCDGCCRVFAGRPVPPPDGQPKSPVDGGQLPGPA